MHFYPHHIGDYQRDTAHLSATDHGVYRLLMDHYYVTEKPLPGDIPTLCRIVRAVSKSERDSVMRVLASFFRASDVGFTHKRIEAEIIEYRRKSEAAANAGKASGEARRAKRDANEKGTDVERTFDSRSPSVGHSVEPTSNHDPVSSSSFKKEAKPAVPKKQASESSDPSRHQEMMKVVFESYAEVQGHDFTMPGRFPRQLQTFLKTWKGTPKEFGATFREVLTAVRDKPFQSRQIKDAVDPGYLCGNYAMVTALLRAPSPEDAPRFSRPEDKVSHTGKENGFDF